MNPTLVRSSLACLAIASLAFAETTPAPAKRLTRQRVAELTAPGAEPKVAAYYVDISGFKQPELPYVVVTPGVAQKARPAGVKLPAAKPEGVLEEIREIRFPIAFTPPQVDATGKVSPLAPKTFESVLAGWTIRLSVQPEGKLLAVYGIADFTDYEMMPSAYGELGGPIHDDKGQVLSPNSLTQPKFTTTSTRFHLFALPGRPYEVTLYRGTKAEKHTVTVAVE